MFQMLTGRLPFLGESHHAVMFQIVHVDPPKPSSLNPEVSHKLDSIVFKCLAKDPDDRYQNAHELADDLRICREALLRAKSGVDRRQVQAGTFSDSKMSKLKIVGIALLISATVEISKELLLP